MTIESAPASFTGHLTALKDHYEAILSEYESQVLHAKEQLSHINALMASPEAPVSPPPKKAARPAAKVAPAKKASPRKKVARVAKAKGPTVKTSGPPMKLAMSSAFEGLSKIEAVEKVFQDNIGKVLHIEDVIERLYGDLSTNELKAERIRMKDVMARGTRRGMWAKVDKVPLSYILESSRNGKAAPTTRKTTKKSAKSAAKTSRKTKVVSTQKTKVASTRKAKSVKRSSGSVQLKLLPPYHKMGMTPAVEGILRDHPGKPMTADEVSTILYGELKPKHIPIAKKRLHDIFSKGVKKKRWKRVPNQKGAYLLA